MTKTLPFSYNQILDIINIYPTPVYIYDERGIRNTAKQLKSAFAWSESYQNFFAIKALPNPSIMRILKEEGMGFDASSLAELELCNMVKAHGEEIILTSNNTPIEEFQRAVELGAIINLDDISHIDYLLQNNISLPEILSFRYNPGPGRKSLGNFIIGSPEQAKFGLTRDQLFEAYKKARDNGVRRFGLHTMLVSNELIVDALAETAYMLFDLVIELDEKLGIKLEFINLGGGIGIPYQPQDKPVNLEELSTKIHKLYEAKIKPAGLHPLRIISENGRFVTGPHGYLVSKVRHLKQTYKDFVGLDASMSDLMRPGMYGAHHEITVIGKENEPAAKIYDVTGSLCENNDKFAVDRQLPEIATGDLVVIHDAGAHAHAMGFNYNGKLRPAEILLKEDGPTQLIRRAETLEDYFATLKFE